MSAFANQLKSEISRLARKEIRAETQVLKKALTQHRSEIAALKRRIAGLESQIEKSAKVLHARDPSKVQWRRERRHFASGWPALLHCARSWASVLPTWASYWAFLRKASITGNRVRPSLAQASWPPSRLCEGWGRGPLRKN